MASEASYVLILCGQKLTEIPQKWSIGRVFEKLKLAGEQCYQSGQFQLGKNWWKMPKLKNPNETFWAEVVFRGHS